MVLSQTEIACVASVSVWFRSKEKPRDGILGFGGARNETRAKNESGGRRRGRKETSRRFTLFPFQKIKNLAFLELQIYHHKRTQIKRVTSSTTYFFFRFSFDDEPFHHKIFAEEKIYLSSRHFIHKSC